MSTFPSYRCENVERNTPIVNTASTDNVKAKSVFNRLRNECIIDLEIELLRVFLFNLRYWTHRLEKKEEERNQARLARKKRDYRSK